MKNLLAKIFNIKIAGETSNIILPDASGIETGIEYKSGINSNIPNGFFNYISEAIQYLQFTVGLFSDTAQYNEGNTCKMIVKTVNSQVSKYQVKMFRRNGLNPELVIGNCPLNCRFEKTNGVDVYLIEDPNADGLYNSHWDEIQFGDLKFHFTIGESLEEFLYRVNNDNQIPLDDFPTTTFRAFVEASRSNIPCYFFNHLVTGWTYDVGLIIFSILRDYSIYYFTLLDKETFYKAECYAMTIDKSAVLSSVGVIKRAYIPISKDEAMNSQYKTVFSVGATGTTATSDGYKFIRFPFSQWAKNYLGQEVKIITAQLCPKCRIGTGEDLAEPVIYDPILWIKYLGASKTEGSYVQIQPSEYIIAVGSSEFSFYGLFQQGIEGSNETVGGFYITTNTKTAVRYPIGSDTYINVKNNIWYRGKSRIFTGDMNIELVSLFNVVISDLDIEFEDFFIDITYQEVL